MTLNLLEAFDLGRLKVYKQILARCKSMPSSAQTLPLSGRIEGSRFHSKQGEISSRSINFDSVSNPCPKVSMLQNYTGMLQNSSLHNSNQAYIFHGD